MAACAISVITVFVPTFKLKLFGMSISELGISYLFKTSKILGALKSAKFWNFVIPFLSITQILTLILLLISMKKEVKNKTQTAQMRIAGYGAGILLVATCTIFYATDVALVAFIGLNEFHFRPVTTPVLIPMIFQIAIIVFATYIQNHYKKAMAGQVKPISLGSMDNGQSEGSSEKEEEMQKAELLLKYKSLFDSGAITEEEYKKLKEKLLNEKK